MFRSGFNTNRCGRQKQIRDREGGGRQGVRFHVPHPINTLKTYRRAWKRLRGSLTARRGVSRWVVPAFLTHVAAAPADDIETIRTLLDKGRLDEAINLLVKETEENPAHEAARIQLAEAYEEAGMADKAITTWRELMALSHNETNLQKGRRALSRLLRRQLERNNPAHPSSRSDWKDPFKIPMPEIDWEGLETVEDSNYLPPIPGHPFEVPPFVHQTKHFTVYSANEKLSKVVGERAEAYLEFMNQKLFGGRSWALRFPIVVYTTESDYLQHGGLSGTLGVTMGHITGKTERILLFQLGSPSSKRGSRRGGRRGGGGQIWKYGIESVLPHELTHAVINEFFAGRPTPRWLHEAIAGRFEQTRDHYGEAARLARKVAAGEFFRMRDLFDQKGYPERIELFYEQSAAVVLYLFETGPETMHVFLSELAAGNGHDAACAAALGIPEQNAVEEFERRWVEWMKTLVKVSSTQTEGEEIAQADKSNHEIFRPWVNETATVDELSDWRKVSLHSLEAFKGVGTSKREWSARDGKLVCNLGGDGASSLLAIRMNEAPPVAVSCRVRRTGSLTDSIRWFGFTQLDADLNDTRVEVLAPLRDLKQHKIVCLWSDDLAIYIDGTCAGRYPARLFVTGDAPDIDYPLALVAYGPLEIQDLKVAPIKDFSDKPIVASADDKRKKPRERRRAGRSRSDRRKRRGP